MKCGYMCLYIRPTKRHSNQTQRSCPVMLMISALLAFLGLTSIYAEVSGYSDGKVKACKRELESILYTPPNCGFSYLKRITESLRVQSPVIWQNPIQSKAAFQTFSTTFGVNTVVINPFGKYFRYIGAPANEQIFAGIYGSATSRANVDGNGFAATDSDYYYSTIFWGPNGEMSYVEVNVAKINAPLSC